MDLWNAITSIPVPLLAILIICLILTTVYMGYQHAKLKGLDGIRAEVYQYMLKAEHKYVSGQGRQKLRYVVGKARGLIPGWMQFFITDDILINLIETWFKEIKDLLDDGKVNESAGSSGKPPDKEEAEDEITE